MSSIRPRATASVLGLVALVCLVAMAVLVSASSARPPTIFVNGDSVATYKFTPRKLEIRKGQTARWTWDSNSGHNVTFRGLGESSITGASESYKLDFKQRGAFRYLCSIHGFRGKIVVR